VKTAFGALRQRKPAVQLSWWVPGLGKLVLVNRKARVGRNPATGETIQIKAKKVVKFRVAKAAKDAILGGKK
jgi:DNA-binding protein HU-beta